MARSGGGKRYHLTPANYLDPAARARSQRCGEEPEAYFSKKGFTTLRMCEPQFFFFLVFDVSPLYQIPSQNFWLIDYSEEKLTACSDA